MSIYPDRKNGKLTGRYRVEVQSGPPSHEAVVAGGAWAIALGQITPRRTGSQHPEDAVEHTPIIDARHTTRFVG